MTAIAKAIDFHVSNDAFNDGKHAYDLRRLKYIIGRVGTTSTYSFGLFFFYFPLFSTPSVANCGSLPLTSPATCTQASCKATVNQGTLRAYTTFVVILGLPFTAWFILKNTVKMWLVSAILVFMLITHTHAHAE